ncbi:MAG: Lon protease family protein [Bacillota bacterium]
MKFNNIPEFSTTQDILPYKNVIGQNRAVASIDLGLKIAKKEYNIFISGRSGTGKTGYIVKKIEDYAKNLPAPDDWCYLFNFEDNNKPLAVSLKTGTAPKFKNDLKEFINSLFKQVPVYFNSKNYDTEKSRIINKYERRIMQLTKEINDKAKENGFNITQNPTGEFVFVPINNDKQLTPEEYNQLSQEEKNILNNKINELRLYSLEILKKIKQLNKEMDEELKHLDDKIAESIIANKINSLTTEYGTNDKIVNYLQQLKKDIIKNIASFLESEETGKQDREATMLFFRRYEVNVLVSNDPLNGAPVIFADSGDYGSLFGDIEYENKFGNLMTDFTLIKPGSLHLANGGFLLVKSDQLLNNPKCWEMLKRCLNLETIFLEGSKYNANWLPMLTLKPENIPLKTRVILIGSNLLYSLISSYDPDFTKLFRIKAEFDDEIVSSDNNISNLIGFLSNYTRENNLKPITRDGVIQLLRYSTRLAGNKKYFTSEMSKILNIVDIADYFAEEEKLPFTDGKHVRNAIIENEAMHGLIRKKILEMYKTNKYVVDLKGTKIGQINGLSVMNYGDITLGQQHKITVATYAGRKGIINIEREANLSGSIHSKGVLILSGYVGELIGQETSISFDASIVFEQLYSGIEGDSASAAELLALLSSLSDIPLKQSLAITGSINQKGEIQPIGGINYKIEGYFDICSLQELDGTHGVVVPFANLDDLILDDRVIDAVEKGLFHIYAVRTIEDCLEIFCADEHKPPSAKNLLPVIKQRVLNKLKKYNKILSEEGYETEG